MITLVKLNAMSAKERESVKLEQLMAKKSCRRCAGRGTISHRVIGINRQPVLCGCVSVRIETEDKPND